MVFGFRASLWYLISSKNFMVICPAVSEILVGVVFHPPLPPDAIKLPKRTDAINRYHSKITFATLLARLQ